MNKFPKFAMTALIITVILSMLAACAPAAAPAPAATQAPAAAATDVPAAQPPDAGKSLTMWTWKVAHVPGLEAVAANFEKETGVKVNITAYNPDEVYRTKITTASQSGDLPDVLSYWSGGQWDLAATDQLVELTDKVDDTWKGQFLAGTYDKSSVMTQDKFDTCAKDPKCTFTNIKVGQSFSVPYLAGNAFFIFGNKKLMTQAGLDPAKLPATAQEWLAMMKTIKEKTGTPGVVTGVQNPDVLHYWLFNPLLITSCGTETYDNIYNGKDTFANPCAMKVLNFMNDLATADLWMPGVLQTNIDPADVAFSQGKAAFDIGGTYTLSFLLAQGMSKDDIVSFAIPPVEGAAITPLKVSAVPLIDAMITKNAKDPELALKWLKYLTSPDQMAIFAKVVGDLPAAKISSDPAVVGNVMSGLVSAMADKSPFTDSKATILDEAGKVLKVGLQQLITKETTPDKIAADVDAANKAAWDARK
jgi:ABC-type glycerol-3-phosphate transport system substrate-binding protein